jgi:hypothetical protein
MRRPARHAKEPLGPCGLVAFSLVSHGRYGIGILQATVQRGRCMRTSIPHRRGRRQYDVTCRRSTC